MPRKKLERQSYPTDITREDFEKIRKEIESLRMSTRPRIHDMYDIVCAMLYVLSNKTGWRELPSDFPAWRSVHEYFIQWRRESYTHGTFLRYILTKIGKDAELQYALDMKRGKQY